MDGERHVLGLYTKKCIKDSMKRIKNLTAFSNELRDFHQSLPSARLPIVSATQEAELYNDEVSSTRSEMKNAGGVFCQHHHHKYCCHSHRSIRIRVEVDNTAFSGSGHRKQIRKTMEEIETINSKGRKRKHMQRQTEEYKIEWNGSGSCQKRLISVETDFFYGKLNCRVSVWLVG